MSGLALCWGRGRVAAVLGRQRGVLGLAQPCTLCVLPMAGPGPLGAGLSSPPVALSQSSVVCAETGVLVGWEPRLWGSRGPVHQALLTLPLGDSQCLHFTREDAETRRGYVASVSSNQQAADLDLNPGLPDPKVQTGNHLAHLLHCALFLMKKQAVASRQVSSMELVLTL